MDNRTMPLLESLLQVGVYPQDTVVLHINHCMENSFYFTEQLRRAFGKAVFVAVPYNDRGVPDAMPYPAYHGVQGRNGYRLFRNNLPIGEEPGDFLHAVRRMIRLALENEVFVQMMRGKRLLIVEDGGYHYPVLRQWLGEHPGLAGQVLGAVEQTTAGTRAGGAEAPPYPVASVARSAYKVRVEAYFIADRVVGELGRMLRETGEFADFHDVLLLGYGIIGRSVAKSLITRHVHLFVRDTDPVVAAIARREGNTVWDGDFSDDMLVLGNVGKPSFTRGMLEHFLQGDSRRIILASTSSKQVEFEEIFEDLERAGHTRCGMADCYRFKGGKELVLLAQGFPLNFYDKTSDSLTYSMIDPVFSEMLLSARALYEQNGIMENRIHLFGSDPMLGGGAAEKVLLERWMDLYYLHLEPETFNRHPGEELLREKTLGEG